MKALALLGTVTGIALFAGIRLYATVLTVGLCLRYGLLHLPQELASLSVAVGGAYAAVAHPLAMLAVVAVFLGLFALLARRIYRRLRRDPAAT